jgi:hypothetical protein
VNEGLAHRESVRALVAAFQDAERDVRAAFAMIVESDGLNLTPREDVVSP